MLGLEWIEEPKPGPEKPNDIERIEYTRRRPVKLGTRPLPEHLERIVVPIDPFAYLADVIERIAAHPASLIAELTPAGWKAVSEQSGNLPAKAPH